ncbi:PHD finger protein 7-like isoform X4 [Chiroxiphia lanceolata]|uniref:PHD finger protein 7-like isoform X4 n=1 Tax=Chiroxiphia lanceolata TaxID=296741 RepID=UPI0013CE92FB|nr:PHD finger protein 7-like isoform X4 [Chiroxiphia lanceolata]
MSDREEEAPRGREPACLLCQQSEADPDICGHKIQRNGICAHVFCLYFASLLDQQENERVGLQGFLPRDILHAVNRAAQTSCCICGKSGATISCCDTECDLSFHLPCAKQGRCVTQFITPYRAFCPTHSPEQAVEATPEPGTQCLICMEPVEHRMTFNTLVCPACKTAWFHRDCIQGQALCSGILSFQCPLCRNTQEFLVEMFLLGIRIPFRDPSWEENDAFAELGDRHRRCDASECLCPGGRQEAEEEGSWELLLCSSCAAEGTHRHCSGLRDSITSWECDGCAGLGTAPRDESELAGPCMARQSGLEPSDSSGEPETTSTNSGSLVLPGLSPSSAPLETISPSTSVPVPSPGTSAPRTSNHHTNPQATSEQSLQTPSQETSSSSPDSQILKSP